MANLFQHYYLFVQNNDGSFTLKRKCGSYSQIEGSKKTLSKLVITRTQTLFVIKGGMRILNPSFSIWMGMGEFSNCIDTIIVVGNPRTQEIEFFISENNKSLSMLIFDTCQNSDKEFAGLRMKSQCVN